MNQIFLTPEAAKAFASGFGRSASGHNQLPAVDTPASLPNAQKFVELLREFSIVSKAYAIMITEDEKKIQQYIDNVMMADETN